MSKGPAITRIHGAFFQTPNSVRSKESYHCVIIVKTAPSEMAGRNPAEPNLLMRDRRLLLFVIVILRCPIA